MLQYDDETLDARSGSSQDLLEYQPAAERRQAARALLSCKRCSSGAERDRSTAGGSKPVNP